MKYTLSKIFIVLLCSVFIGIGESLAALAGTRITVRALMNRTFHREHVCTQCGKALYYSPE